MVSSSFGLPSEVYTSGCQLYLVFNLSAMCNLLEGLKTVILSFNCLPVFGDILLVVIGLNCLFLNLVKYFIYYFLYFFVYIYLFFY